MYNPRTIAYVHPKPRETLLYRILIEEKGIKINYFSSYSSSLNEFYSRSYPLIIISIQDNLNFGNPSNPNFKAILPPDFYHPPSGSMANAHSELMLNFIRNIRRNKQSKNHNSQIFVLSNFHDYDDEILKFAHKKIIQAGADRFFGSRDLHNPCFSSLFASEVNSCLQEEFDSSSNKYAKIY